MRKIVIVGILIAIVIVSVGLVTAGFGRNPNDGIDDNNTIYAGNECGTCDGNCNGNGQCSGTCTSTRNQNGECTGICDGEGTGKQCNNQQCLTGSNACGGCKRN